jgi:hypothetical protein
MNDQDICVTSVFLNILAILGFMFFARTPLQTTADILGIAVAAIAVSLPRSPQSLSEENGSACYPQS